MCLKKISNLKENHEDGFVKRSSGFRILHSLLNISKLDKHVPLGHSPQHPLEGDLAGPVNYPRHNIKLHRGLIILHVHSSIIVQIFNKKINKKLISILSFYKHTSQLNNPIICKKLLGLKSMRNSNNCDKKLLIPSREPKLTICNFLK